MPILPTLYITGEFEYEDLTIKKNLSQTKTFSFVANLTPTQNATESNYTAVCQYRSKN